MRSSIHIRQQIVQLALARRAAQESIVLLRNERGALPLRREALKTIALIGPQVKVGSTFVACVHIPHAAAAPTVIHMSSKADDWRQLMGAANYAFIDGSRALWILMMD